VSVLRMIAEKQEAIMLQVGPANPLVTPKQLYNTYSKLVQEAGFKNPDAFFSDPEGEEAQERMAQQPEPPPDPKVVEAQAKMQLEQAKAQAQLQLEQQKAQVSVETAREK